MAFLDRLLPVAGLVAVGLSGVRLARLLLDGLRLVVLLGGERLGDGEMDIGLSGELISALRFLCGVCCSTCCILFCWRGWRSVRSSFSVSFSSNVVLYFAFSEKLSLFFLWLREIGEDGRLMLNFSSVVV